MTAEEGSMRSFADQESSVEIALPNGWMVTIRPADLGIRRDLDRYLSRLNAKDGADPANRQARIQAGDIFVIQNVLTKVVTPERTFTAPIGMQLLRKIDGPSWSELISVVNSLSKEVSKP